MSDVGKNPLPLLCMAGLSELFSDCLKDATNSSAKLGLVWFKAKGSSSFLSSPDM
jgi:hypothetical protein